MKEWNAINAHESFTYLIQQVACLEPYLKALYPKLTTPIIPTNLFLYFSVN